MLNAHTETGIEKGDGGDVEPTKTVYPFEEPTSNPSSEGPFRPEQSMELMG